MTPLDCAFYTLTLPAAMTRITFVLSLFAVIAVLFFSVSSASAQVRTPRANAGLIQGDYEDYARQFRTGREPNFTTNENWRRRYTNNQWNAFALGTEFRDPIVPAQTLAGIYLISHIDVQLKGQISDIVWSKAGFGAVLSEGLALDRVAYFLSTTEDEGIVAARATAGSDADFRSEMELNRMELLNRDLDLEIRKAIVNPARLTEGGRRDAISLQNRFIEDGTDWVSRYYFMRQRFNLLDDLAAYFPFNWTGDEGQANRARERERMMQDEDLRQRIEAEVREERSRRASSTSSSSGSSSSDYSSSSYSSSSSDYDSSSSSGDYSDSGGSSYSPAPPVQQPAVSPAAAAMAAAVEEAAIQADVDRLLRTRVATLVSDKEDRYKAFRYLVGSYASSEYYFVMLRTIRRHFESAANAGDPIAQYHLALFLIYLGDIVDPHATAEENRSEALKWLERARMSELAKRRVDDVERLLADAATKEPRRRMDYARRLNTLIQVEEEKIDMYIEVLIRVQERLGSGGSRGTGTARNRNFGSSDSGSSSSSSDSGSYY